MKKFFASIGKALFIVLYIFVAGTVTILSGCKSMTPTRKPPLVEKIGYEIPDFKGWTTVGINEAIYNIELEKIKLLAAMIETVNAPALAAREQAIDWFNIALSGGMLGGIPLALRRLPRGAVKKEDHEREVTKAGLQDPEEFKQMLT